MGYHFPDNRKTIPMPKDAEKEGVSLGESSPKIRNYWKYLKAKLKKEENELGSVTTQLKLKSHNGKKCLSNMLDYKVLNKRLIVITP